MRALLQRVSSARVIVEGRTVGEIGRGFCVLLGVTHTDTNREADWLARKIAGLRLFEDAAGKLNLDLAAVGGEVLLVSQFTLYGDARKGRRPSFIAAARPERSEPLYEYFGDQLRQANIRVATGIFGAEMTVEINNDGPVTMMLEREVG